MGRFRRKMEEIHEGSHNSDERYQMAYRRMKRVKGFYTHLMIYILVNAFIIAESIIDGDFINNNDFWQWETFSTPLFWGIGLLIHGVSVFGETIFFSMNWEERKIKEFMGEETNQKWQ